MTQRKAFWIDPRDCGLATLEEAERKRKAEEEARRRAAEEARICAAWEQEEQCRIAAERLRRLEEEERERKEEERRRTALAEEGRMTKVSRPLEGEIVRDDEAAVWELKGLDIPQQLQRMDDMYAMLDKQIRNKNLVEDARRRSRTEDARANAEVERYDADAREHKLRGYPAPPPTPEPPPEDPRPKAKAKYEQELERLTKEEAGKITNLTGGKPEAEWSDDTRAEVVRTKNMYGNAREKVRDKLRGVL